MKLLFNILIPFAVFIILVSVVLSIASIMEDRGIGAAPDGTQSRVSTSSVLALTVNTATRVFATSTNCSARVISTLGTPINVTFSEIGTDVPTGSRGVWQAASTTVAYDASIYGCNAVNVFAQATNPIYVMETR